MKILQIHSADGFSQAAGGHIAMSRLHLGLKKAGIDSKILCGRKSPGIDDSTEIRRSKFVRMSEALIQYGVTGRLGFNNIQCFSSFGIKKNPIAILEQMEV